MDSLTPPNHTQTPNVLFDVWLPQLKESELKILLIIIRQTLGWHKKRDRISLTLLERKTGLGRSTIAGVLRSPKFSQIVHINRQGNTNEYSLKLGSSESEPVQNLNQGSSESEPVSSSESEHTKETIKETITKESVPASEFLKDLEMATFDKGDHEGKLARLTIYCHRQVLKNYPNHDTIQKATLGSWYHPLRKLVDNKGWTFEKVKTIFDWAVTHERFWKANIRSTDKFYQQREELEAQYQRDKDSPQKKPLAEKLLPYETAMYLFSANSLGGTLGSGGHSTQDVFDTIKKEDGKTYFKVKPGKEHLFKIRK